MNRRVYRAALGGSAAAALLALAAPAVAIEQTATYAFDIPSQDLGPALLAFGRASRQQLVFDGAAVRGLHSTQVAGNFSTQEGLQKLLNGTGLRAEYAGTGAVRIVAPGAEGPQDGSAGGGAETNVVQELVVTAQKKEEAIQTVPIAISAFSQKTLEAQHIEGGFDLLKAIPNVTFSKNNFSGYNFSIRGIGTKAVSVTTDPGVAVEFNSTALIRNRLFEQEYFDVERVEVLRGPQGTLHGRNATAGVINVISAKPTDQFDGSIKAEVGNYQSRRASGFINIPIIGDKLDVRFAGSFTDRQGYDYNATTQHRINGRDLWSGRLTVGFKPFERLHGDFVWEHFDENDDRSRTGKQLCHRDPGPTQMGQTSLTQFQQSFFSQGCKPGSLYNDSAFGTPNGLSIPFILVGGAPDGQNAGNELGYTAQGEPVHIINFADPYGGMMQSRNLRVINSFKDPTYRAKADVFELNFDFDLTHALTFTSQTAYDEDQVYSFQDYNRFNTVPIFNDSSGLLNQFLSGPSNLQKLTPGGIYCDPQLGCSNSIAGFDISQASSTQFSQEIKIQSSFSGRINFSAGANYTRYKTLEDYYVMYNLITLVAQSGGPLGSFNDSADYTKCIPKPGIGGQSDRSLPLVDLSDPVASARCIYIDPNPVDKINGQGHNYFRSENPYKLWSAAAFGEIYGQVTEPLKVTAGLRYTDDNKTFTPIPSQILLASGILQFGFADRGYPALPDIKQHWGEFSGRLGVDWQPKLSFTDQSLLYAFYSRGYKGGGANPPGVGFGGFLGNLVLTIPKDYGPTFKPEFVNAFEIGSKNTLLGGSLVANGDIFFYDYKDYQVSQIKDRTAVNENFSAKVWGAELESIWQPARNSRFNMAFGYQGSRINDGAQSIDLMNRTQGRPGYVLVKPFVVLPSNCVASVSYAEAHVNGGGGLGSVCLNAAAAAGNQQATEEEMPNGGAGFYADLGGKELPNAPHWTVSLGGQQSWDFLDGWRVTLRADAYWQAQSWARVYNDNPYDKLHGWYNANLSLWFEKPETGLKIEIYAKNVLDKTPITDAFLNSDDTALTTNVFVLDPRLIGFSITKKF